jgi:hypothetical protein
MLALGDITERCLRFFGVTKERVKAVIGRECGCANRQAAMNEWGYRLQHRLSYWIDWFRVIWARFKYGPFVMRVWTAGHLVAIALRVLLFGR